jgi:hypothetical protein
MGLTRKEKRVQRCVKIYTTIGGGAMAKIQKVALRIVPPPSEPEVKHDTR